jgi:SAM-dependent methyltransferase
MSQRQFYAYYDKLFATKDYAREAGVVVAMLNHLLPSGCHEIVDVGCGTGRHASEFARLGVRVHGIDIVPEAIDVARRSLVSAGPLNGRIAFDCVPIDQLNGRGFDAAVSLFNVLNYILDTDEMEQFLFEIRKRIRPGGAFVFDCWNGVAAIASPPEIKISTLATPEGELKVHLEPETDLLRQYVRMKMTISPQWKGGESFTQVYEHRLWTPWELTGLLGRAGFDLVKLTRWMQPDALATQDDWKIMAQCRIA